MRHGLLSRIAYTTPPFSIRTLKFMKVFEFNIFSNSPIKHVRFVCFALLFIHNLPLRLL